MRVAVLVTGQPRHFEQGAWWFRNKVFPEGNGKIDADYFCHFWDDGTENLLSRIKEAYNTDSVIVHDYHEAIDSHSNYIRHKNSTEFTDWTHVPIHAQENMLFNTPHMTEYGKNWHGQFISTGIASEIYATELQDYDIVIKTRSDCILNNMSLNEWLSAFSNIHRNAMLRNMLFANWLYVKAGQPHHGDFAFFGAPDIWLQYGLSINSSLKKICTEDKHWFKEVNSEYNAYPSHWLWNKLNIYSKNDWLSFSVAWPTRFDATLVRDDNFVYDKTFQQIQHRFNDIG